MHIGRCNSTFVRTLSLYKFPLIWKGAVILSKTFLHEAISRNNRTISYYPHIQLQWPGLTKDTEIVLEILVAFQNYIGDLYQKLYYIFCFLPTLPDMAKQYKYDCPITLSLFIWCAPGLFHSAYFTIPFYDMLRSVGRQLRLHWPTDKIMFSYYIIYIVCMHMYMEIENKLQVSSV